MSSEDGIDFAPLENEVKSDPQSDGIDFEPVAESPVDNRLQNTLKDIYLDVKRHDPKRVSDVVVTAQKLGVEPIAVAGRLDAAKTEADAPDFDIIQHSAPITSQWLSKPSNMAMAHRDIEHTHRPEKITIAHNSLQGFVSGLESSATGLLATQRLPETEVPGDASLGIKLAQQAGTVIADLPFMTVGGGAGALLGLPAGPAAGITGMAGAFALPAAIRQTLTEHYLNGDIATTGELVRRVFSIGKETSKSAALGALTYLGGGAGLKVLEGPVLGAFERMLPGAQIVVKPGAQTAARVTGEFVGMTAGEAAIEGKAPTGESLLSGGILFAGMGAAGHIRGRIVDARKEYIGTEVTKAYIELMDQTVKESELRNLNPEAHAELLDSHSKPVIIPKEAFEKYFQGKNLDPKQVARDLKAEMSYDDATRTGGNLVIPMGKFQSKEMDTHRSGLMDDVKFNHEDRTVNELKDFFDQMAKESKETQDSIIKESKKIEESPEMKAAFDSVYEDVRSKRMAGPQIQRFFDNTIRDKRKMSEKEWSDLVDADASLWAHRMKIEAFKQGRPIEDVYQGGVGIREGLEAPTEADLQWRMEETDRMAIEHAASRGGVTPVFDAIRNIGGLDLARAKKGGYGGELTDLGWTKIFSKTGKSLDVVSQELFDKGLITENSPNAVFDALDTESRAIGEFKTKHGERIYKKVRQMLEQGPTPKQPELPGAEVQAEMPSGEVKAKADQVQPEDLLEGFRPDEQLMFQKPIPDARFIGMQKQLPGEPDIPLFNVTKPGHERFGSTVTEETLKELGLEVPEKRLFQVAVESDAFKRWFGESKVVDESGKPIVVYHGSGGTFLEFDNSKAEGIDKNKTGAFWFSDSTEIASKFAGNQSGQEVANFKLGHSNVVPVYLSIKNPFIDDDGIFARHGGIKGKQIDELKKSGYDGIIWPEADTDYPDTTNEGPVKGFYRNRKGQVWGNDVPYPKQFAVFDSSQIKSAIGNIGTFDPSKRNILFQSQNAPISKTNEFLKWFGKSVLIDKSGEPTVFYHGTADYFTKFDVDHPHRKDSGWLGTGIYLTDNAQIASSYANLKLGKTGENVIPLYAKLENPYYATQSEKMRIQGIQNHLGDKAAREAADKWTEELKAKGHDGVILEYKASEVGKAEESREIVVFDKSAIKSVFNKRPTSSEDITFQEGQQGPRAAYIPSEKMVELFKTYDPAGFQHESAHHWLERMHDFVKKGQANAEYMSDWKIVSDYLGIKEGQEKIETAQHEKFAKSWERYLSEGKAPTPELQVIFERFKEWMLQVYGNVKEALGVELTDDMRGFFDRQLATKEEIAKAREEIGQKPLEIKDATPEQTAELSKLHEQARLKAEELLLKPQMEELSKRNQKILSEHREKFLAEAKERVPQRQVHKAGKDLHDQFGKDVEPGQIAEKFIETGENQFEFDVIAELNGYVNGDEMARAIVDNAKMGGLHGDIRASVEESMKPFAPLKDTEAIKTEAMKAVHNEQSGELLAMESQVLKSMKFMGEVNEVEKARRKSDAIEANRIARMMAKETLSNLPIKEATAFRKYYTAERNAAVRAERFTKSGDYEKANKAKIEQLNAHHLSMEANRVKVNVERWLGYLQSQQVADPTSFKTEDHFYQAADILRRFGFDRKDYIGNKRTESLAQWRVRMEQSSSAVDFKSWIENESVRKDAKELTPNELKDVKDAIKNIKHIANQEDKTYVVWDKADLGELSNILAAEQQKNAKLGKQPGLSLKESWIERMKHSRDSWLFDLIATETWLKKLDGYQRFGPWWRAFFEKYAEGADNKAEMTVTMAEEYRKIWEAYTEKERLEMGDKSIDIPEIGGKLTKNEIMTIAMNWGNSLNKERLLTGWGWEEGQIQQVLNREMTKRDWDTVQKTWDMIDTMWPKISELYKELTGFTPEKVEREKFFNQHGEYAGGYFPLRRDPRYIGKGRGGMAADAELKPEPPAWRSTPKNGFTKERVKGAEYRVSLDINGVQKHLTDVIHDVTMRKWVLDANRLLDNKTVQASLEDALGKEGYMMMRDWVADIAGTKPKSPAEFGDGFVNGLRRRTVISGLGLRVSTLILQADDISAYGRVDPSNLGVGQVAAAIMGHYKRIAIEPSYYHEAIDFVNEHSKYMKFDRGENIDKDIADAYKNVHGKEDYVSKVAKASMKAITVIDQILSRPVWIEGYKTGLGLYEGNEVKAVQYADNIIRQAQSSGRQGELPRIMKGSEKMKLLTMFYSFTSKRANMWYEAFDKGKKDIPELIGTIMALGVVPAMWGSLVHYGLPTTPEKRKKYLKDQLTIAPSLIPGVRDMADYAVDKMLGNKTFGYSPTPITRAIETTGDVLGNLNSNKKMQAKIEAVAKAGSFAVPFPDQINAWVFNAADIINNKMKFQGSDLMRRRPTKERHK